ncbi:hypothetical protein GCM10009716_01300 [Streptomyces sodiiphilus]|uniref:Uncharacterized protein n=1 Tax=Streptomyces sodiiphilus TaxID=226217 RepID=A0ABN2NQD8_9ACTN
MAHVSPGTRAASGPVPAPAAGAAGRRHPLVAAAIVLPLGLALAVVFGGVDAIAAHVSTVAGLLRR